MIDIVCNLKVGDEEFVRGVKTDHPEDIDEVVRVVQGVASALFNTIAHCTGMDIEIEKRALDRVLESVRGSGAILDNLNKKEETNTLEEVGFVPVSEWEPENEFQQMVKDYFGEQIIGMVMGVRYPGYSEDKNIVLKHTDPQRLFRNVRYLLNGRRFYVRGGTGCTVDTIYGLTVRPFDDKAIKTADGRRMQPFDLYRLRIFPE